MPERYTRSRSRLYRNYSADQDDRYDAGSGGGYEPRRSGGIRQYAVVIAVAVVAVVAIGFLLKSTLFAGGASPTDTPLPTVSATDTTLPTESADATASDLATASPDVSTQPSDTATSGPSDSSQPSDTSGVDTSNTSQPSDTSDVSDTSQPDNSPSPTPTDTPQPTDSASPSTTDNTEAITPNEITGKATNVTDYLPLRSSASSTADNILDKIKKDETFTVLKVDTNSKWLKVKYNDKTGYVLASYVTVGSSSQDKVCTITSAWINVRSGAGKSHKTIGTLKSGDTVVVISHVSSSDGMWYKIKTGDSSGYVIAQYCRISS